jgi:hypothetical protein
MTLLFDAQVNYGRSAIGPNCDMNIYLSAMRGLVSDVLFIPSPTHDHLYDDGTREISCLWELVNGKPLYTMRTERNDIITTTTNPVNPYERFNREVIRKAEELTAQEGIRFSVAIKHHPLLDTKKTIRDLLYSNTVKAIKIHGIATHTAPGDVQPWLAPLAREADVPLFIHTDYSAPHTTSALQNMMKRNTARAWYKWVEKTGVRAFLAHGLRLDTQLLVESRKNPRILIGMGPISLLENEPERLCNTEPYLEHLLQHAATDQLAFCSDYRWNVWERNAWDDMDWKSHERLIDVAERMNMSPSAIRGMLHDTAATFFARS